MGKVKDKLKEMALEGNDKKGDTDAAKLFLELEEQERIDELRKELFGV